MNIITKVSDTLVKVHGSVDSSNAPQFEEELLCSICADKLTIDAEDLTYISSAGLRVLLKAKKALSADLTIINVNPEVYDILDMTGFTQILKIQKAIRKSDKKFIAVGCHFDVEDWLLPDWVFDTNSMTFRMCEGSKKKDQTATSASTNSSVRIMPSIGKCSVAITI